ncbi:hypothetical protein [Roseibium sp.]|uniref:hypothetical protein n=1 Tax=Roseibium sp. TaxID=1936156 RepID=UPI003A971C7A
MYTWIAETFGIADGLARGLAFAIALGIVLILIALFVFILKRLTGTRLSAGRSRQPRIAIMDATNIDTRRRLLLIRRDNVEHLILVGGPSDIVVEQGIIKSAPLTANNGRPQAAPSAAAATAPGYSTSAPPETLADTLSSTPALSAGVGSRRPAEAPTIAPVAPQPSQPPRAQVSGTAPATDSSPSASSRLNPARSLLKAAAAGKISSAFGKPAAPASATDEVSRTAPAAASSFSSGTTAVTPPRQADRPQPAVKPATSAPAISLETPSRQSGPTSAPSVKPTTASPSLSSSLAAARPNAVAPRQVTPPSSGPAARARTAFLQHTANADKPATVKTDTTAIPEDAAKTENVSASTAAAPAPEQVASDVNAPSAKTEDTDTAKTPTPVKADDKPEVVSETKSDTDTSKAEEQATAKTVEPTPPTTAQDNSPKDNPEAAAPKTADDMPNPIEDEMAKLLDEIHGPQKQ